MKSAAAAYSRVGSRTAVAGIARLAGAGDGADKAGYGIDLADPAVQGVEYIEIAVGVESNAVGVVEQGVGGRTAIAAIARLAGTGDDADNSGIEVESANAVAVAIGDIELAVGAEAKVAQGCETCFAGVDAVGHGSCCAGAGDGGDEAGRGVDSTDAVIASIGDV